MSLQEIPDDLPVEEIVAQQEQTFIGNLEKFIVFVKDIKDNYVKLKSEPNAKKWLKIAEDLDAQLKIAAAPAKLGGWRMIGKNAQNGQWYEVATGATKEECQHAYMRNSISMRMNNFKVIETKLEEI